jgi:hypothetical protein
MCFGGGGNGGGGGDSAVSTRPGEEAYNPNAPAGQRGGEGQTYSSAMRGTGRWTGDTRSDQEIQDDVAVTEALWRGDRTFTDARGNQRSVAGYSRNMSQPLAGSLLAGLNDPPTIGGATGFAASRMIGGPVGFLVGQGLRMGVNSLLGDRSSLGGR